MYRKVRRSWVKARGEKVIGVRWIDINNGDSENPDYRSRLVAKYFKTKYDAREDLYAATPPTEALRLVVSHAATLLQGKCGEPGHRKYHALVPLKAYQGRLVKLRPTLLNLGYEVLDTTLHPLLSHYQDTSSLLSSAGK